MWTCPKCGEVHDDQFDSCWKCAREIKREGGYRTSAGRAGKKICLALCYTTGFAAIAFLFSFSDLATGRTYTAPSFFPYAYWVSKGMSRVDLFEAFLLGQFPVYGIIAAISYVKGWVKIIVATVIIHILFVMTVNYLINVERQYRVYF